MDALVHKLLRKRVDYDGGVIRDATLQSKACVYEAHASSSALVLRMRGVLKAVNLTEVLELASRASVLRSTVFVLCRSVSALPKTLADRASNHDIQLNVMCSEPDSKYFSLLALGIDVFELGQMPLRVEKVAPYLKPAHMLSSDPIAVMYGLKAGDFVRIVHRKGADLENNDFGIYSGCPVVLRQVVSA